MCEASGSEQALRFAMNAALFSAREGYRQSGISRYIGELLAGIGRVKSADDELILFGQHTGPIKENLFARVAWEQTALPIEAVTHGIDVLHCPFGAVPLLGVTPSVLTVHDVAFRKYPYQLPHGRRLLLSSAIRAGAKRAEGVITVSRSTAEDLVDWFGVASEKIHVIPLAISSKIQRIDGTSLDVFRIKWELTRPYVLAVGTLEPRKNLPMLLRAFAAIKDDIEHELVLVGPDGWLTGELKSTLKELKLGDRVRLTGFVSDQELGGWYSAADLFAFPSHYEGFGLPSVEAMRCGTPILCSDNSSFPEVVGEAGVMLPADDQDAWSTVMRDLLQDESRRRELSAKGIARAAVFSWDRTAQETLNLYQKVAS